MKQGGGWWGDRIEHQDPASVQGAKKVASDSLGIHLVFNTPLLLNPMGSLQ